MKRTDKINHELQRALSFIIQDSIDDPNLGMLSVVRVETSPDMRSATVYYSIFPEEQAVAAENALSRMNKHIRGALGRSVKLKYVPELCFCRDEGIKNSVDIFRKIEELKNDT